MQTTNLGNVAVENFGVKRSRVPINRNVFSSCGFGEVQVCQLLQVDPDTETSFSVENLTFVEPIVAPTYGHCSIKYWHYFVAMRDLFEDFDSFLASANVRKMGGLFVTRYLPHTYRNLLSTLLLWGAKCTIYVYTVNSDGSRRYRSFRPTSTTELASCANVLSAMLGVFNNQRKPSYMSNSLSLFPTYGTNFLPTNAIDKLGINTGWIDARALIDIPEGNGDYNFENGTMRIPLANYSLYSYMDLTGMPDSWSGDFYGLPVEPVVIGKHDYLIERPNIIDGEVKNTGLAFVFKATAFGKRIAKVLKGSLFQEDFTSVKPVSLMPLFATYKAYYECFGLLLYTNFENTNCKQLLVEYEQNSGKRLMPDFTVGFFDSGVPASGGSWVNNFVFQDFIKDMGSLWVTDSQDLTSAHQISPAISVSNDGSSGYAEVTTDLRDFIRSFNSASGGDATGSAVMVPDPMVDGGIPSNTTNPHAFIDRIKHSQVDCELLKILYLNTNHETLAGKRVAQLLEMAGYGDWMAHQKPRFIGYDEQSIEFNQIQSKADTLKDGSGMILGERGGVGESYKYHKQHTFTNNETGYIISLCAVVPDSGYVNTLNVAYECISKYDFFDQRFDGVGMELSPISRVVCGSQPNAIVDKTTLKAENVTDESFGYVPMETRHKFVTNIFNGVFALNSVMDNFTPYSLDKVIKLAEIAITSIDDSVGGGMRDYNAQIVFDPKQTPRAGLVWRYPTRYPWLGRLARIFAAIGDNVDDGTKIGIFNMLMNGYEYFNEEQDGFVLLQTIRGGEWTHKLPITDSYETREDGNKGNIDTNVSKA